MISTRESFDYKLLTEQIEAIININDNQQQSFAERLMDYIGLGKEITNFENGYISRVTGENYLVLQASTLGDKLKPGMEFELCDTLCKEVIKAKKTVAVPNLSKTDLYDLPGRVFMNLESVIGSPIFIEDEVVGTISFCSSDPFENDIEFQQKVYVIDIMGKQVSQYLALSKSFSKFSDDLKAILDINLQGVSLEEKLQQYIEVGKTITNFDNGFISKVEGEKYTVVESSTINDKLKVDMEFSLCDTLCEEVVNQQKTIALPKLKETPFYEKPGRAFLNTESVIGTPIYNKGNLFGTFTLCSVNEHELDEKFHYYSELVDLIGKNISHEISEEFSKKELKSAEQQIIKQKNELYLFFSSLPDLYLQLDADSTILNAVSGDKFRKLQSLGSILKKKLPEILPAKVAASFEYHIGEALKNNELQNFYFQIKKGGKLRHNQVTLNPIGNNEVAAVIRDVTKEESYKIELKRINEELSRSNKELEKFAYVASHDLQEPLRKIQAFGSLLEDNPEIEMSEEGKMYLHKMIDASHRMQNLISSLLVYSRVLGQHEMEEVNLNNVLKNVMNDLAIDEVEISIDNLPSIKANNVQMYRLFQNLISNSIKFQQKDKKLKIDINKDKETEFLKIIVSDNGIGFDNKYASQIFDAFKRLHTFKDYEGNGIGLSACTHIVNQIGGKLEAYGEPNVGAKFTIYLPNKILLNEL